MEIEASGQITWDSLTAHVRVLVDRVGAVAALDAIVFCCNEKAGTKDSTADKQPLRPEGWARAAILVALAARQVEGLQLE